MTEVEKLDKYVRDFVKIYEKSTRKKLKSLQNHAKKPGKTAETVEKGAKVVRSVLKGLDPVSKTVLLGIIAGITKGVKILGTKYNKKELEKLVNLLYTDPKQVRPVLVAAAVEIFVCYQQQLLNVTAGKIQANWKWAMRMLAEDAAGRFFDFFKQNCETEKITADDVTKGVVKGTSKDGGKTVKYNQNKEWNTSEMYSQVGLVKLGSNGDITGYFTKSKEKCDPTKFSYRLLFPWEETESFEEIAKPDSILDFSIKRTDIEQHAERILKDIKKDDQNLMEGRIHSGVAGAKAEVLDAIELLGKKIDSNLACNNPLEESLNARPDGKGETSASSTKTFRTPIFFRVRRPADPFIGRTTELQSITMILEAGNKVVLTGTGGMGKTELAAKYVKNKLEDDKSVNLIWFNATTTQNLKDSVNNLAREKLRLTTTEHEDAEEIYRLLADEKVIFIFDDAKDYNSIRNFLPVAKKDKHKFLITSNMQNWHNIRTDKFEPVEMKGFDSEDAFEFIKSALAESVESQDDVEELAKEMGRMPLALLQATVFIKIMANGRTEGYTISKFLQKYREKPYTLLKNNFVEELGENAKTIYKTFEIALEKLKEEKLNGESCFADIAKILSVMSYLSPNEIPRAIFLNKFANGDDEELSLKLFPLKKYSIVKEENEMLSIHGLNQLACRLANPSGMTEEEQLGMVLNCLGTQDSDEVANHVISVWDHAFKYESLIEKYILNCENEIPGSRNPLGMIIDGDKLDMVKKLLENITPAAFRELINASANVIWIKNLNLELVELLWDKEVNDTRLCKPIDCHSSLLHMAADHGHRRAVRFLVEHIKDIDPNIINIMGFTPLHYAAKGGHFEVVEFLLNINDVNVNPLSLDDFSPLHLASANGHLNIVIHLIDKGANIAARTKAPQPLGKGYTAYELAERNGHKEITQFLDTFRNPLLEAARNNNIEEVKRIIESGDTRSVVDNSGRTAVHYAAMNGHIDIVRYLETHYDLTAPDNEGTTPLRYAACNGHQAVAEFLIFRNRNKKTLTEIKYCCHLAYENGHEQLYQFLGEIDYHYRQYRQDCHRRRSGRYRRSFDSDLDDDDDYDDFFWENLREHYELERRGD